MSHENDIDEHDISLMGLSNGRITLTCIACGMVRTVEKDATVDEVRGEAWRHINGIDEGWVMPA